MYKALRTNPSLFSQLDSRERAEKLKQIQKTEYIWIIYKEGMLKVSKLVCPNLNTFSVATILTKQRTKQLEELALIFK